MQDQLSSSRTTTKAKQRCPQIDLEALGIDFALGRCRHYIHDSPNEIQVIRTERIKLRHQDIRLNVVYQQAKINQSNYLPRHAIPIERLP